MPKYYLFASETIYYMKEVEAESADEARDMVYNGKIDFDFSDVTDGKNFNLDEVEEEKRYA